MHATEIRPQTKAYSMAVTPDSSVTKRKRKVCIELDRDVSVQLSVTICPKRKVGNLYGGVAIEGQEALSVFQHWLPRLIWIALGIAVALALVEYFQAHH
jgi:hypothetical protein